MVTALWVAAGLAVTAWFVAGIVERQIEAAADARLNGLMDAVIAVAATDASGRPRLDRVPAAGDFNQPFSGEYWHIAGLGGVASSRSLWDDHLVAPLTGVPPGYPMMRNARGPRGDRVRLLEMTVEVPGVSGPLTVQVAASRARTDAEIARLRRVLGLAFGVLGLGLVGGVAAQVVWGLRPLRAASEALAAVRAGKRDRLALAAPSEIAPLVEEVDALIGQNRETVERARAHLGNLAHALKTPVAVLANALHEPNPNVPVAAAQTRVIERIVQHHLARARSAALPGADSAAGRASPAAVAEEVAAALRRLQAERNLTIVVTGDPALRVRMDRQDLIEVIGNLMENACKWADRQVSVQVIPGVRRIDWYAHGVGGAAMRKINKIPDGIPALQRSRIMPSGMTSASDGVDQVVAQSVVTVVVEDDGPGLPEDHPAAEAVAVTRGERLDETVPGAGLGLAIVADLAGLYGGRLMLGRSSRLGGASVRLALPGVGSTNAARAPEARRVKRR